MIKIFKKALLSLSLALTLTLGVPKTSDAGIILVPVGVGIIIFILGIATGNGALVLLDENNGGNSLVNFLAKRYPQIDNYDVLNDLSNIIKEKMHQSVPNSDGKIHISIEESEIIKIFEPTGLLESNPEVVENIIKDFQF